MSLLLTATLPVCIYDQQSTGPIVQHSLWRKNRESQSEQPPYIVDIVHANGIASEIRHFQNNFIKILLNKCHISNGNQDEFNPIANMNISHSNHEKIHFSMRNARIFRIGCFMCFAIERNIIL